MLRFHIPKFLYAPDTGAGGAMPTAEETAAASARAEAAATGQPDGNQPTDQTTTKEAAKPEAEEKPDALKPTDELSPEVQAKITTATKDAARLAKTVNGLQSKLASALKANEQLRRGVAEKPGDLKDVYDHPALKGLPVDEDTGEVTFEGQLMSPEHAVKLWERDQSGAQRDLRDAEREAAELQKQIDDGIQQMGDLTNTAVQELVTATYPNLNEKQSAKVNKLVMREADEYLTNALKSGEEFTPELAIEAGKAGLKEARETFGLFGDAQYKSNAAHEEENKSKPDGQPGEAAPAVPKTKAEIRADQEARVKRAEAATAR